MSLDGNDGIFTAGQVVGPGTYLRIDVPNGRTIDLEAPEALPASLDGMVALYRRVVPHGTPSATREAPIQGKRLVAID